MFYSFPDLQVHLSVGAYAQSLTSNPIPDLSRNALNPLLQLLHIPAHNALLQGLSILKQHERRHRAHLQLLRHGAHLVHVHLNEAHVGVRFAEFADDRRNGLAGTAPGCEEVDDDGAGGG